MMNPISSAIKSGMESYADREASMRDRVAETSINAQKVVDERHGPYKGSNWWQGTRKSRDFDHFFTAHSSLKGRMEGNVNSFIAARYYQEQAANRRDELIAQIQKEEMEASSSS